MVRKILTFSFFGLCLNGCQSQTPSQINSLSLIASIPLPNVSGRIDHLSIDSKNQIIYVAALGNNTVEVINLETKKHINSIEKLREPQGIIFLPVNNSILVANGDDGACDIFDAGSFQKINSIPLGIDADNVRYDSIDHRIYVGYGDGGIAIIDAINFKLLDEVKLSGHPESFQLDLPAKKIYVNVPDHQQIEVIDLTKNIVSDQWKVNEAASNFPMSLDVTDHRLFIGCRHPAKLIVLDTQTGKTVSSFDIDGDVDDIFYDNGVHRIYLSCGEGYVDIFNQMDVNTYTSGGKIRTSSGARTSLFIPGLNQLIVASPSGMNNQASLLVYEVK